MSLRVIASLVVLAAGCGRPAAGTPGSAWRVEVGPAFAVKGDFVKGKDVSAATGLTATQSLVASDEPRGVQAMSVDPGGRVVTVREMLPLVAGEGSELDLEAMAVDREQRAYFITGSHSLSRKKQQIEPDRSFVFRLPVDADGRAQLGSIEKASLRPLLEADDRLQPFLDQPASSNGLDIEGLAFRDGRLFFGLRAPTLDGRASVVEVPAKELFAGGATATRHELELGMAQGIRELVALGSGGFLVLSGPSGSDDEPAAAEGFSFWHWGGPGKALERIGDLPKMPGKAEGVLVLNENDKGIEGLLFCDGAKDGEPRLFRLVKPSR